MQSRGLVLSFLLAACGGAEATAPRPPIKSPAVAAPKPPPSPVAALAEGAKRFDDLGRYHMKVTATPEAQAWFDQGLRLNYGFNHDEATRSFAKGAEVDPACAMCFWGAALTMGPNYNVPMLPDRAQAAWGALQRAQALAPKAAPVEQALIGALAVRYKGPEPVDPVAMQPQNVAYADAMRAVAKKFPDSEDAQVLFAEAMMDTNPWHLWTLDGQPAPGTEEIVATLEAVLAKDPNHPGANHYYIHAVEASPHPEKALAAAERLPGLIPGAGHIVHMPAHIFQRIGRYADASAASEHAVKIDQAYFDAVKPPGYYPMYLGHNWGFLAFAESMRGRGAASLAAARTVLKVVPPEMMDMMPGMDFFFAEPILVMVRFGRWDELLAEPRPAAKYIVLTGLWLHGHGMALAGKGRLKEALADHAELVKLAAAAPPDLQGGNNVARDLLNVGAKILEARIATLQKKKNALALWAEAVALEDKLAYSEPADWFYPVRHYQGAALLAAHEAKEAEAVYREDLRRNRGNGWALFGLGQALRAQRKDAKDVDAEFGKVWEGAEVRLTTSAF
jgi:tetratricopeptide (TPR) repeat protein